MDEILLSTAFLVVWALAMAALATLMWGKVCSAIRERKESAEAAARPQAVHTGNGTIAEAPDNGRELYNSIFRDDGEEGHCPICHSVGFYAGPEGGMSQNIHCRNVACRTNVNITPVIETAEIMGRRGFDWYPDGPEKDRAALAMLRDRSFARAKGLIKVFTEPFTAVAEQGPDHYGWAVVIYEANGRPWSITGPYATSAEAHNAATMALPAKVKLYRSPPEPHRDPDNTDNHLMHAAVLGAILSNDEAAAGFKAPGEPLVPGGGSFGGGGASGSWDDKSGAVAIPAAAAAAGAVMSHAAPAYVPPDVEEIQAQAEAAPVASVSADASPSYSSSSYDSGSSSSGGDSGGGGGGGGGE
jgi:uncharacterized membrane protein YgcG